MTTIKSSTVLGHKQRSYCYCIAIADSGTVFFFSSIGFLFVNHLRQTDYVLPGVCLFVRLPVCLSVCLLTTSCKATDRIFTKILPRMHLCTSHSHLGIFVCEEFSNIAILEISPQFFPGKNLSDLRENFLIDVSSHKNVPIRFVSHPSPDSGCGLRIRIGFASRVLLFSAYRSTWKNNNDRIITMTALFVFVSVLVLFACLYIITVVSLPGIKIMIITAPDIHFCIC